jgi:hypothetical protein
MADACYFYGHHNMFSSDFSNNLTQRIPCSDQMQEETLSEHCLNWRDTETQIPHIAKKVFSHC